LLAVLSID